MNVRLDRPSEAVAVVVLDKPERGNSLDGAMHQEIRAIWEAINADPAIRAVVLTGAGERHFCTGADVGAIAENGRISSGGGPLVIEQHWTSRQNHVLKPVICAVNGLCAGAGLHFVADSDIVLAASHAAFTDPHVNVGMVGGIENTALAFRMPLGAVLRMTLVGRDERMSADRAYQLGLVDEVLPGADLLDAALAMATKIAANSPSAVERSKQAIWQSREAGYAVATEYAWSLVRMQFAHPDFREGPAAFRDKRPPHWVVD